MQSNNKYTITLDDDPLIAKLISRITGINSLPFTSGSLLLKRAKSYFPVAAFIDVHVGVEESGLDVIPNLRSLWPYTPLLVVTSDPDNLVGDALALGANDFVRKPINNDELLGRMHARIREMNHKMNEDQITIGDVVFSKNHLTISSKNRVIHIPKLESLILLILSENQEMIVSREEILQRVWGNVKISQNTLDKKISKLRKELHDLGSQLHLESQYGKGIKLLFKK
jgi:DNA-binding response OmpR family regulator